MSQLSPEQYVNLMINTYPTLYVKPTRKFLELKWEKEKSRILEFIDETIDMLENIYHLKPR